MTKWNDTEVGKIGAAEELDLSPNAPTAPCAPR